MKIITIAIIGTCCFLNGCAAGTKDIHASYVSDLTYQNHDCDQLQQEVVRLNQHLMKTGAIVDDDASDDKAQAWVGALLLWPTLFFLEGNETQHTQEYAQLKGQYQALERVSIAKKCNIPVAPLPEPVKKEPVPIQTPAI